MIPAKLRAKFATECELTALGGSERGTCGCVCPSDCEMQWNPHFGEAASEATDRMTRLLMAGHWADGGDRQNSQKSTIPHSSRAVEVIAKGEKS